MLQNGKIFEVIKNFEKKIWRRFWEIVFQGWFMKKSWEVEPQEVCLTMTFQKWVNNHFNQHNMFPHQKKR